MTTDVATEAAVHKRAESSNSLRQNNFDLVRIVLALIVVFVHSYDLSGSPELAIFRKLLNAHMAVEGFFVISGFLIVASYERSKTLREYIIKRARRILPGYWLAALFCVVIAACFNPHLNPIPFLLADMSFLTFLHPGIAGVFTHNPGGSAMDGALWTLKTEVLFYAVVPSIVWACRRYGRLQVLLPTTVLSIVYRMLMEAKGHETLSLQIPGQMSFFCLGALAFYYLPIFKDFVRPFLLISVSSYLLYMWTSFFPLRPLFITGLTLYACLSLPQVKGPTRWGDFSYGTYVLHWPIIQALVALGVFARSAWLGMVLVLLLVSLAAVFSWFAVERRWLARRRHSDARPVKAVALAG